MENLMLQRLIAALILSVLFALPSLIIYLVAYQPNASFNSNAVMTTCNITDYYIYNEGCSSCFDGYISVDYFIQNNQYTNLIMVYSDVKNYGQLQHNLETNYKIGTYTDCYYNRQNFYDSRLKLYNLTLSLIFICIFLMVSISSIIIWIFYELNIIIKNKLIQG